MADVFLPTNLIVSNVQVKHYTPTFYNESINLKGTSKDRLLHRIEGSFDVNVVGTAAQKSLESFLLKVRGRFKPFYFDLGARFTSETVTSTVTVSGAYTAGDTLITLGAFTGSVSDGDLFTVANDNKVYMAMETESSGGILEIFPPLMKNIPDATVLDFTNVNVYARLDEDVQSISYEEAGLIHMMTINFKEAL